MPLNRDQPSETDARNSASSVPSGRQYAHSIVSDLSQRSRPATPQNAMNTQSARRENFNSNVTDGGRKHALDVDGPGPAQPAVKDFRMPPVDTLQKSQLMKPQHSASTRFYQPVNAKQEKQENLRASTGGAKSRKAEKEPATGFDDTASLNQSMYDDYPENDLTTIRNSQRVEQYSARGAGHIHEHDLRGDGDNLLEDLVQNLEPGWAEHADEERRLLQKQSFSSKTKFSRENSGHVDSRPQNLVVPRMESLQQPETPTRARSAPPNKDQLPAPVPRTGKIVGFADADEIHPFSPAFQSSEMGNEDAFQQPTSRPNSAQPRVQTTTDQRPPRTQQHVHSQPRQNFSVLPLQSARFEQSRGHLDTVRQGGEKVSAPESDNQDFSEDERTQTQQQYGRQDKPPGPHVTNPHSLSMKRSYDDMSNDLDYSLAELGKKSLSALQAEAFTRDPRTGSQSPPTDSVGNEMTLPQILENLSKVPEDAQRETFKNLTDEQWARTGQWFVDKFQADLTKLTEIRLQRRHIAMRFEDQIRRRQRLVEHHEAEVDRELKELQTGGKQLVDGRKVPSGSRSGTPMKGGR